MEMIWLIQTLLDTNIQLKPNTRHAQGLPVHYGFLTMRRAAACVWVVKEDKTGEGVGEWWREGSTMYTADVAHECFISMHFKLLKFSLLYGKIMVNRIETHHQQARWLSLCFSLTFSLSYYFFHSVIQMYHGFWKTMKTFLHHSLLSV